jgi:hypothetical protein
MPQQPSTNDFDDIPALLCINCNKVSIIGGILWEDEHPSTVMCDCGGVAPDDPLYQDSDVYTFL